MTILSIYMILTKTVKPGRGVYLSSLAPYI